MNQFIYAFLGGVVFCYMLYYTKSIWAPILSHFIINAFGALMSFAVAGADVADFGYMVEYDVAMTSGLETILALIFFGFFALIFIGGFIGLYILFKRHNLRRNEAEGIITNTAAAAQEAGLQRPVAATWSFWVTVAIFAVMMFMIYIIPILIPMMGF